MRKDYTNLKERTKNTRFPVNRQNHTQKGPYLVPLLRKFLNKKINFEDPETQKMIRGRVKDAVIWRLLLNACQGENQAIKEILDRIDGKSIEFLLDQSQHTHITRKLVINGSDSTDIPLASQTRGNPKR